MSYPPVSIIIPVVRPIRARTAMALAVSNAGIPSRLIEIVSEEDRERIGCPKMVQRLVEKATHSYVAFLGDDVEAQPNYLKNALDLMMEFSGGWGLVGFNDGFWDGDDDFSTHWLGHKNLLLYLDKEFFHTGYFHCCCDKELAERTREINRYAWAENAKIEHENPKYKKHKHHLNDEHYARIYDRPKIDHDVALFERRKANGWRTPA